MGTCCSSRTDPTGKDKAAKSGKTSAGTAGKSSGTAVKFNPMDEIRNTVTQVLKDSKSELIMLHRLRIHEIMTSLLA